MQVNVVTEELVVDETGPVLESHWDACPETIQAIKPAGLAAPATPVTTALKVSGLPRVGFRGTEEVTIVGTAGPTTTDT